MKKVLLIMVLLCAVVLAVLGYERLFVQKTFGGAAIFGFVVIGAFMAFALLTLLLYDTRHRSTLGGIWMAGLTTVTFYLIADAVVGWFLIKPLSPALVPDEHLHHRLVPDSYSRLQQPEFSYTQRVNKLGMRGREVAIEKPDGVVRILALGDSFTMGKGVEDHQTFSVVLEGLLNESAADSCKGKVFEVLNGGVDSYAPVLSNIALRRDFANLSSDLILHNLDVSDLVQEAAYRKAAVRDSDGNIVAVPNAGRSASTTDRLHDWINQHLFFTRALLYYTSKAMGADEINVRTVATQVNRELVAHTLANDTTPRDAQWADIFESVGAIRDFAESKGSKYALIVYPWGHEVSDGEWMPGRYVYLNKGDVAGDRGLNVIRRLSAENGITLGEMHPVFRAYDGGKKLYFDQDNHWTVEGQRVMAQGLEDFVRANYWAAWCQ